ncbi:MAG: radical SAM protein [Candidatus Pacearchaeota archaeon]
MLDKRKTFRFFESEKMKEKLEIYLKDGDCYPSDVVLHLNNICNHQCDFCYNFLNLETKKGKKAFSLDKDYIINLIDEFSYLGIDKLIISGGGEPLLYTNIKEVLEKIIQKNFSKFLYTNLDDNIDDLIELLVKLDGINVNINTINEKLYRTTRGRIANFNRVKRNLERLIKEDVNLTATIIVRDNTINTLEKTIYWLNNLGIENINVSPAFDLDYKDGLKINNNLFKEMEKIKRKIYSHNIRILEPEGLSVKDKDNNVVCKTHYFDITIGADYGVYPCCATSYLDDCQIVNLKDYGSFQEAWNSKERHDWIKQKSVNCKTCWFSEVNKTLKEVEER